MKLDKWIDSVAESPLKALVWLVVVAALCFVAYKVYSKIADAISTAAKTADYDAKEANLSYPNSWYKEAAASLYAAMDGVGTDESRITSIIVQLHNADDWNALVSAYGYKKLHWGFYTSFEGTLPQCLVDELGSSDLNKIRQHLQSIGAAVGF